MNENNLDPHTRLPIGEIGAVRGHRLFRRFTRVIASNLGMAEVWADFGTSVIYRAQSFLWDDLEAARGAAIYVEAHIRRKVCEIEDLEKAFRG